VAYGHQLEGKGAASANIELPGQEDIARENYLLNARTRTMSSNSPSGIITQNGKDYYLMMRDPNGLGIYQSADGATAPVMNNIAKGSGVEFASEVSATGSAQTAGQIRYNFGKNEVYRAGLEAAAARTGFDPAQVAAIVNAEAATRGGIWNPESRNSTSSAYGLTQFLEKTWIGESQRVGTSLNELAQENGWLDRRGKVLLENRGELLQLRANPDQSIMAAAEYMQYNLRQMDARGLIPTTAAPDERVQYGYIAHHEGLGGATELLRGTLDNTRASALLDQQAGRQANIWGQRFDTSREAYKAWLFDYTRQRIRPQVYRVPGQ
jgi:hypothetical protein